MHTEPREDDRRGADRGSHFPRSRRLRRRAEFRTVFDAGRSSSDQRLIVYALQREVEGPGRLGLAIGRKYGSSPERNRWKRLVREAFRTRVEDLPPGHDLVVLPVGPVGRVSLRDIASSLVKTALAAAKVFRERGPRRRRKP